MSEPRAESDEAAIRADERRIFADYFDLRATELANAPDQYAEVRWLRSVYLDVANMIRFNETAGGNDGHPISHGGLRQPPGSSSEGGAS